MKWLSKKGQMTFGMEKIVMIVAVIILFIILYMAIMKVRTNAFS